MNFNDWNSALDGVANVINAVHAVSEGEFVETSSGSPYSMAVHLGFIRDGKITDAGRAALDLGRPASAIEAQRAETPSGSVADESAGPKDDAHD